MLFKAVKAADRIRLWVAVMYIDCEISQSAMKEMALSNGETMFLAKPEKQQALL